MRDAHQKMMRYKNYSILLGLTLLIHLTSLVHLKAALLDNARTQLGRHSDSVTSIAFSPDGRSLAAASGALIKLWDIEKRRGIAEFKGHRDTVSAVVFSQDGRFIVSASQDNTVKLWNVALKNEIATFKGHTRGINAIAFTADGKTLASGSRDNTVKLWDIRDRREIATFLEDNKDVKSIAFSPDGETLVSAGDILNSVSDATVKLWDVSERQELDALWGYRTNVTAIAFSPDGKTFASAGTDNTVRLWQVENRNAIATLEGHSDAIFSVAFSPDGKTLASASRDDTVKLWDMETGNQSVTLTGHRKDVKTVAFSPDGSILASSGDDGTIFLWNLSLFDISSEIQNPSDAAPQPFKPQPSSRALPDNAITQLDYSSSVYAVAFSPDGKLLASGVGDKTIQLWDTVAQRELTPLTGHEDWVTSCAFSPDGKLLASASADKTVRLWHVDNRREIKRLKHSKWVQTVRFSPNGGTLASGSVDSKITAWTINTPLRIRKIFTVEAHRGAVSSIAFSPNADTLASGSYDGTVKLWAVRDKHEISPLTGHSHSVYSVAFSPDGKMLASGSSDNTVKLWDVSTGQAVATLEHTGYVESVTFSPDAKILATALTSVDDNVNLWDVSSRTKLASLKGHTNGVTSVAFSRDGKRLATGSRDRTVFIWNLLKVVPVPSPLPDTVPPEIAIYHPSSSPFTVTADVKKIIVSGSATDSSGIAEVRVNGKKARVLETGAFKAEVSLKYGPNSISIVATDIFGNQAAEELTVSRGGDNTPPEIVIAPPIPPVTTAERLSVSGIATDASGIFGVTVNREPVQVSETGAFKAEVSLSFGKNTIVITAIDTQGNLTTKRVTVTREDVIPPEIVINYPPESPFPVAPDETQKIIRGTVTDSGGILEVTVSRKPVQVLPNGAFQGEVPLAPGENHITITAKDRQGNEASEGVTFIRNRALKIDINHPDSSPFTVKEGDKQIIIAGNVTPASGIRDVTVNEEPVRMLPTGKFKKEILLDYGENKIRITATDKWGKETAKECIIIREPRIPDSTPPEIFITLPPEVRGFQRRIVVTEEKLMLSGRAQDASGIAEVRVNGEQVQVSATGKFVKAIILVRGENRIRITATDTWGNQAAENLIIHLEPNGPVRQGKDYALLFAANSYEHWQELVNPILDAGKIKTALKDTYGFEVELIPNPTMQAVFAALRKYAKKTYHDEDQLMIFFAGHGHFDADFQIGYLVARDSELPANDKEHVGYISHPLLKEHIDNIACKHIFLMIDACFSGTLDHELLTHRGEKNQDKPVDIERVMQYQTRRYMTSGGNEYVPDKSEFAYRVLEALRSRGGEDGILTLEELFGYVEQAKPQPRQGKFGYRNEPGSDFLFIAK